MADASPGAQKLETFIQLLPAAVAIAGLAPADHGKYFSEDQMELRARSLKQAFKHATALAREIAQG